MGVIFNISAGTCLASSKNLTFSGLGCSLFSSGAAEQFQQYEMFGVGDRLWGREIIPHLSFMTELNVHAGIINVREENAFYLSMGPNAVFNIHNARILAVLGMNPTIISKKDFYDIHLGGPLQFTLYAEVDVSVFAHTGIGFRTQHVSNADIYKDNHGFNTYMVLLTYYFNQHEI